jgi:hypothetical protein
MYRKKCVWNAPRLAPLVMAATLVLVAAPTLAQRQQQPNYYGGSNASALSGKTVFLPAGTSFEGRLNTTIGSSASRQGQVFEIEVTSPVLANGTEMIIPGGSKIDGEVVEAIPSGRLPHKKGYVKPTGKLRTQLTLLHTPDGMTYPLLASLAPEESVQGNTKKRINNGNSVGYVGSPASFDAVAPGAANRFRGNNNQRGPQVVTKQELQRDPLYGRDAQQDQNERGGEIRSLMKKGHEIYIYSGSPVTIRLDGPLKIGVANAPGSDATFNAASEHAMQLNTGGRRFSHGDTAPQLAPTPGGGDGQAAAPEQNNNPLPFLQPGYQAPPTVPGGVVPGAVPGAAPYSGQPVAVPPQYQQQQQQQGAPGSTF